MVDQQLIDRVAAAIDSTNSPYSMTQVRLVDGINTYTLTIDGMPPEDFTDTDFESATDQVYARIREVKHRKQAEAVITALSPARIMHLRSAFRDAWKMANEASAEDDWEDAFSFWMSDYDASSHPTNVVEPFEPMSEPVRPARSEL